MPDSLELLLNCVHRWTTSNKKIYCNETNGSNNITYNYNDDFHPCGQMIAIGISYNKSQRLHEAKVAVECLFPPGGCLAADS